MQRKPRLKKGQISRLQEHFVAGSTARTAADLIKINRNTASKYFKRFREIIAQKVENEFPLEVK